MRHAKRKAWWGFDGLRILLLILCMGMLTAGTSIDSRNRTTKIMETDMDGSAEVDRHLTQISADNASYKAELRKADAKIKRIQTMYAQSDQVDTLVAQSIALSQQQREQEYLNTLKQQAQQQLQAAEDTARHNYYTQMTVDAWNHNTATESARIATEQAKAAAAKQAAAAPSSEPSPVKAVKHEGFTEYFNLTD